ncbi:hypothetical protein ACLOJK_019952 [Asimina triloba]
MGDGSLPGTATSLPYSVALTVEKEDGIIGTDLHKVCLYASKEEKEQRKVVEKKNMPWKRFIVAGRKNGCMADRTPSAVALAQWADLAGPVSVLLDYEIDEEISGPSVKPMLQNGVDVALAYLSSSNSRSRYKGFPAFGWICRLGPLVWWISE